MAKKKRLKSVELELSEDQIDEIREFAKIIGKTPDEIVAAAIDELLAIQREGPQRP